MHTKCTSLLGGWVIQLCWLLIMYPPRPLRLNYTFHCCASKFAEVPSPTADVLFWFFFFFLIKLTTQIKFSDTEHTFFIGNLTRNTLILNFIYLW